LLILQPFTLDDLNRPPRPDLVAHFRRLKERAIITAKEMRARFPGSFPNVLANLDKTIRTSR